ncbi:MoxR family ATPase [Thermofilum sp.]|uniref:MoxR family ATPase n=1 Tax=Thermofilum sp. TaxID=1961369 RepID=UPI00316B0B06
MRLKDFVDGVSAELVIDKKVLTSLYTRIFDRGRTTPAAFLLAGPPGTGKTSLATTIAKILKANFVVYQATIGTTEDDLIYKILPSSTAPSGVEIVKGPLVEALESSQRQMTVLLIDEFEKSRPSTDAMLLDFLQNTRITVRLDSNNKVITGNPQNLIVFLTSNNERELSEPLMRRLRYVELKPLPPDIVYKLLLSRYPDEKLASFLTQLYVDTQEAKLRKQATIQELYEVQRDVMILKEQGEEIDYDSLILSAVIKDPADFATYVEHVKSRQAYEWVQQYQQQEQQKESVVQYYQSEQEVVQPQPQEQPQPQPQPQQDPLSKIPKIVFDKPTLTTEKVKTLVEEKGTEVLTEQGMLPTNEEVYDALIKVFGIDIEKGSRKVHKVTFFNDYAVVDKLDFNDIKRLTSSKNEKESNIILKSGKLLFQFEVDKLDINLLVYNLKDKSFTFKYKSERLIRARKESEYGIFDVAIENPTSESPIIEMFVEGAIQSELENVVYYLLRSQSHFNLAYELRDEMKEQEFSEDVIKKWQNIDLNKYNRNITTMYREEADFDIWLCSDERGDCKQDIIEQRRKQIDEQIEKMNAKLQKLQITTKHSTHSTRITVKLK